MNIYTNYKLAQNRHKKKTNLQVGALVLLKDGTPPPLKWDSERTLITYPEKNKKVREATVKTSKGTLNRNATLIYPFPKEVY